MNNKDIFKYGEDILNSINKAAESGDFSNLSRDVKSAVGGAAASLGSVIGSEILGNREQTPFFSARVNKYSSGIVGLAKTVGGSFVVLISSLVFLGTIGASAQIGRTQGLEEAVKKHSNWKIVAQQTGEFTQSKGQEVMESILKSVSKIDVVYAENDNMAWGAIDAIKAAGKKPGKDIIIITFDAVHESFNRMINGEINCAVECNPLHGPRTAEIIQKLENKQKVDKIQYVTELVFDKNGVGGALKAADELPNRKY